MKNSKLSLFSYTKKLPKYKLGTGNITPFDSGDGDIDTNSNSAISSNTVYSGAGGNPSNSKTPNLNTTPQKFNDYRGLTRTLATVGTGLVGANDISTSKDVFGNEIKVESKEGSATKGAIQGAEIGAEIGLNPAALAATSGLSALAVPVAGIIGGYYGYYNNKDEEKAAQQKNNAILQKNNMIGMDGVNRTAMLRNSGFKETGNQYAKMFRRGGYLKYPRGGRFNRNSDGVSGELLFGYDSDLKRNNDIVPYIKATTRTNSPNTSLFSGYGSISTKAQDVELGIDKQTTEDSGVGFKGQAGIGFPHAGDALIGYTSPVTANLRASLPLKNYNGSSIAPYIDLSKQLYNNDYLNARPNEKNTKGIVGIEGNAGEGLLRGTAKVGYDLINDRPDWSVGLKHVFALGGNTPAEYEVEKDEVVQGNDTQLEEGKELASDIQHVGGNTHENGGTEGAGGERVFSDRLKLSQEFVDLLKSQGVKGVKANSTYAEIAKSLGNKKGKFEKKLENGLPDSHKTATVMLDRINKNLDSVFQIQEVTKQIDEENKYKKAYGGYLKKLAEGAELKDPFANPKFGAAENLAPDNSPVRTANQNITYSPREVAYQKAVEEFPINDIKPEAKKAIINSIIGNVDISSYATDPNHEKNVSAVYNKLKQNKISDSYTIDSYIKKLTKDKSPLKGDMIVKASKKYGVDPELITAILQQDSSLGTKGLGSAQDKVDASGKHYTSVNYNPGNLTGKSDKDSNYMRTFNSWDEGVDAVAEFLSKHKVDMKTKKHALGGYLGGNPKKPINKISPERQQFINDSVDVNRILPNVKLASKAFTDKYGDSSPIGIMGDSPVRDNFLKYKDSLNELLTRPSINLDKLKLMVGDKTFKKGGYLKKYFLGGEDRVPIETDLYTTRGNYTPNGNWLNEGESYDKQRYMRDYLSGSVKGSPITRPYFPNEVNPNVSAQDTPFNSNAVTFSKKGDVIPSDDSVDTPLLKTGEIAANERTGYKPKVDSTPFFSTNTGKGLINTGKVINKFGLDNADQLLNVGVYLNNLNTINKQKTSINRITPNPIYSVAPNYLPQNLASIDAGTKAIGKNIDEQSSNIQDTYSRKADIVSRAIEGKNTAVRNQGELDYKNNVANAETANRFGMLRANNTNEDAIDKLTGENKKGMLKTEATNALLQGYMGNQASKRAYDVEKEKNRIAEISAGRGNISLREKAILHLNGSKDYQITQEEYNQLKNSKESSDKKIAQQFEDKKIFAKGGKLRAMKSYC